MLALNIKEKQFLFLFLKQKVRQVLFDHQERIPFTYKQIYSWCKWSCNVWEHHAADNWKNTFAEWVQAKGISTFCLLLQQTESQNRPSQISHDLHLCKWENIGSSGFVPFFFHLNNFLQRNNMYEWIHHYLNIY